MKRIGGLKQQVGAGVKKRSIDGMLPNEQIDACHQCYREIMREQQQILKQLRGLLEKEGVRFCRYDELDDDQKDIFEAIGLMGKRDVLEIQLDTRRSVWDMQPDGTYAQRQPGQGDDNRTVHEILIDLDRQRLDASSQMEGGAKKPASKSGGGRKRNVAHKAAYQLFK